MSCPHPIRLAIHRIAALLAIALLSFESMPANAIDAPVYFRVNTTADLIDDNIADHVCHTSANTCSLRAAIMQTNHQNTNGLTRIDVPPGIYKLTLQVLMDGYDGEERGDLNLTEPIDADQLTVIAGVGSAYTIIDGNQSDSVLSIDPGRKVTIFDATIRNGYTLFSGGGISNRGKLDISFCVIEGNRARSGGGIDNFIGTLHVSVCTVRSNIADDGGGISVGGNAKIEYSTISGNTANTGGGINNDGELTVVNSTVSGNTANANGGGIYSRIHAYLYNTSVIDNIADLDHDEAGGIGGGVYSESAGGSFLLTNSLIVRNTTNGGYDDDDCYGTFQLYGFNLFGNVIGCTLAGNGDAAWRYISSPSSIGPLQDNGGIMGGHTQTHALLAGSNAIDTTYDQGCIDETGIPLPDDQRGAPRVAGQRCDVGAFEFGAVVDTIFYNGFGF